MDFMSYILGYKRGLAQSGGGEPDNPEPGGGGDEPDNPAESSTLGYEWIKATAPDLAYPSRVLCANNKLFCGTSSTFDYHSSDGKTWSRISPSSTKLASITYGNGLYVAGSSNDAIYYSEDGATFTKADTSFVTTSGSWNVAYGNGVFVAGSVRGVPIYSEDGRTWAVSNLESIQCAYLVFANGVFVFTGSGGTYYSEDGKVWTQSDTDGSEVYAVGGMFLLGTEQKGLCYSEDGKSWTMSNLVNTTNSYKRASIGCAAYADGLWVVSGAIQTGYSTYDRGIWYSEDGKMWTHVSGSETFQSGYVMYADGVWLAGGSYGVCRSADGKTWEQVYSDNVSNVKYLNGVAVGYKNSDKCIYYSE